MESVSFETACPTIKYTFDLIRSKELSLPEILVITFTGKYRDGSSGAPDAVLMSGVISIATDIWQPHGVLLDLSDFEYNVGEEIEWVFDAPRSKPTASVIGPKCRRSLSTLIKNPDGTEDIVDNVDFFESRDTAIEHMRKVIAEAQLK